MNQILQYTPQKGGGSGGSSDKDKVVSIFAILLIFLAIALIGVGVYNKMNASDETAVATTQQTNAEITITQVENTDKAIIKVVHDKAIEKIVYKWNNAQEVTIKSTGENTMEQEIDLPNGKNTITVRVIDIDKYSTTVTQDFDTQNGKDIQKPIVQLATEGKNLIVTVTDETALSFVTYNWNEDEEKRIDAEEGQTKISFNVEILSGENTFNISAVDTTNNTTVENKKINGVTEPVIESPSVDMGSKRVDFLVKHESGIKKIELKVNDEVFTYDAEQAGGEIYKELPFNTTLQTLKEQGQNYLYLKVTSFDNTEKVLEATF